MLIDRAGDVRVTQQKLLGLLGQLAARRFDLVVQLLVALIQLFFVLAKLSELRLIFLQPIGDFLVANGEFLGAALQLFLQGAARLLTLHKIDAAFAQGLAFGVEAFLRFRELIEPALPDACPFRKLRPPSSERIGAKLLAARENRPARP